MARSFLMNCLVQGEQARGRERKKVTKEVLLKIICQFAVINCPPRAQITKEERAVCMNTHASLPARVAQICQDL